MIDCKTLGPMQVLLDGRPPSPELLWRKHLALLIYLARSPRRTRTRDHLAGLLWPEKPEAAARHSLNEALRVIRRNAGDHAIEAKVEQVTLDPGAVSLDVDELEQAAAERDWTRAGALIVGPFLEGFTVPRASAFEDWLAAERRHWTERCVAILSAWSEALTREGRLEEAVAAGTRALELDPASEGALGHLLRALALAGEPAAALQRAEIFETHVREQLETEPSASLRRLVARIRGGKMRPAQVGTPAPAAESRRTPLIGRGQELDGMLACADRVRTEGATVVVVRGDPGTGKSRLLEELAARVRLEGATVAAVRAVAGDRDDAMASLLALAKGPMLAAPGLAGLSPSTLGVLVAHLPAWRERFPHVAGVEGGGLERALIELLEVMTEEAPLVLIVDDAHEMDHESLAVLAQAVRDLERSPLLLVLAVSAAHERVDLDDLEARAGRDYPGAVVTPGPLDEEAIRAMIRWALPGYDATQVERLGRRLAMDSAGLPLLATELLHAVACGLDLEGLRTAWPEPLRTLDQSMPGDLPDTIVASIRVGFRQLSDDAQAVLVAVAVIPERSSVELLRQVVELPQERLDAALDELEWTRWLAAEPRGYDFVARITKEVVARDMLTPGQRQRLRDRLPAPSQAAP